MSLISVEIFPLKFIKIKIFIDFLTQLLGLFLKKSLVCFIDKIEIAHTHAIQKYKNCNGRTSIDKRLLRSI